MIAGSKNPYSALVQILVQMYHRLWRKREKRVDYLQRKCDNMIEIIERNREGEICLNEKYIMKYFNSQYIITN